MIPVLTDEVYAHIQIELDAEAERILLELGEKGTSRRDFLIAAGSYLAVGGTAVAVVGGVGGLIYQSFFSPEAVEAKRQAEEKKRQEDFKFRQRVESTHTMTTNRSADSHVGWNVGFLPTNSRDMVFRVTQRSGDLLDGSEIYLPSEMIGGQLQTGIKLQYHPRTTDNKSLIRLAVSRDGRKDSVPREHWVLGDQPIPGFDISKLLFQKGARETKIVSINQSKPVENESPTYRIEILEPLG